LSVEGDPEWGKGKEKKKRGAEVEGGVSPSFVLTFKFRAFLSHPSAREKEDEKDSKSSFH
jgi:hypothetical protein